MLLNPRNSSAKYCKELKINVDDSGSEVTYRCSGARCPYSSMYKNVRCKCGKGITAVERQSSCSTNASSDEGAFLKGGIMFIISDDLHIWPSSPTVLAQLIPDLGSRDGTRIREMQVQVSKAEVR
ncbi:unnamed protein product [Cuscuta europaea]|uniref:Uncharacterized protein n=1 Tax=Cuscuta europaea TaxID=41803 RepID=A0A9P0ZHI1_CUSEU|nr:unnamed protein product [Cuscuta europaea]